MLLTRPAEAGSRAVGPFEFLLGADPGVAESNANTKILSKDP